jgi:large subunit ribosomal protein L14
MIFTGTNLYSGDNSGARRVQNIKIISRSKYRWGFFGDIALVTVKKARPNKRVKKSEKWRFVLINMKKNTVRLGHVLRFTLNAGVVLKKDDIVPFASRVTLNVPFELRPKGFRRILTMASINI